MAEGPVNITINTIFNKTGVDQAKKAFGSLDESIKQAQKTLTSGAKAQTLGFSMTTEQTELYNKTLLATGEAGKVMTTKVTDGLTKMRKEMDFTFLTFLFAGMAMQRVGFGILKSLGATYSLVTEQQGKLNKDVLAMRASWEYLKFSIVSALENSALFTMFRDKVIEVTTAIGDFFAQNPDKATLFMGLAAAIGTAGTLFLTLGMIKQMGMAFEALFGLNLLVGSGLAKSITGIGALELWSGMTLAMAARGLTIAVALSFLGWTIGKLFGIDDTASIVGAALGFAAGVIGVATGVGVILPFVLSMAGFIGAQKVFGLSSGVAGIAAGLGLAAGTIGVIAGVGFTIPFLLTFAGIVGITKGIQAIRSLVDKPLTAEGIDEAFNRNALNQPTTTTTSKGTTPGLSSVLGETGMGQLFNETTKVTLSETTKLMGDLAVQVRDEVAPGFLNMSSTLKTMGEESLNTVNNETVNLIQNNQDLMDKDKAYITVINERIRKENELADAIKRRIAASKGSGSGDKNTTSTRSSGFIGVNKVYDMIPSPASTSVGG